MNIESLLGKMLQETIGLGSGQTQGQQRGYGRSQSSSGSLLGSLTNQLTSGQGLMTAIGLGVGAYEILRGGQQQSPPQAPSNMGGPQAAPPPLPPLPSFNQTAPPPAPTPAAASAPVPLDAQEMARRLIRVMVAAAHADGSLDAEEEKAILDRLRGVELSPEEKTFLLEELHQPRSIAELSAGITGNLRLAQTMYAVALSAITVDTESERRWLDELGTALGLSAEVRKFIEETR